MPYKSAKQRRFFQMCKHSPSHAKGKCPDSATLDEFESADRLEKGSSRPGPGIVREKMRSQAKAKRKKR